jgi:hypothetical protein
MNDRSETIECSCGRILQRGNWRGTMGRLLESHQQSRECMAKRIYLLEQEKAALVSEMEEDQRSQLRTI